MTAGKKISFAIAFTAVLSACGGGGGGGTSANDKSTNTTVSGVASIGAPLAGASVIISSLAPSSECIVYSDTGTSTTGQFSVTVDSTTCPGPYLVRISGGSGTKRTLYGFAGSNAFQGLVITPFSSAAVALAAGAAPEEANFGANLTQDRFTQALGVIYKAGEGVFRELDITEAIRLALNPSFVADGTGPDQAMDLLSVQIQDGGSIQMSSKFGDAAVSLGNLQSQSTMGRINRSLASEIFNALMANNRCLGAALNRGHRSDFADCAETNFREGGQTASQLFDAIVDEFEGVQLSSINTSMPPALEYCEFDDRTVNIGMQRAQLLNKSGVCYANITYLVAGSPVNFGMHFRFTVETSSIRMKAQGNQIDYFYEISPFIEKKSRVDGLTRNAGISSGYRFDIDTGRNRPSGIGVLSAEVTIRDKDGASLPGGNFYLRCQQGNSCNNSSLSICTDSTCNATDDTSSAVVRTNTALARAIADARLQGPVKAHIRAYADLNRSILRYDVQVPLTGQPIPQEVAERLSFPELTSVSQQAMANFRGEDSLELSFEPSRTMPVSSASFGLPGSSGTTSSVSVSPGNSTTRLRFSGLSSPDTRPVASNCSGPSTYRSLYLEGIYRGISFSHKYFGSCSEGDY